MSSKYFDSSDRDIQQEVRNQAKKQALRAYIKKS